MTIIPREINSYDELIDIEDEIFEHVITLDTMLNRTFIEINYNNKAWLMISDQAWNMEIVTIPMKTIKKDKELQEHLLEHYWQAKRFISLIDPANH